MEKCNIDKHFGNYRYLFENQTDLDTFVCPDFASLPEDSLYGLYGDTEPYSFYNFAIRPCVDELDGDICYNSTYIKSFLNQVFLDVRTVDFSVANFNTIPYFPVARGDRFTVSQSIFRRIWMKYKSIDYNSDIGYVFSENIQNSFHQLGEFSSDVDMRDQKTNVTPYTFLWLTLINSNQKSFYYRSYLKAQTMFANVGGIIKLIFLIANVLNFTISKKLYYSLLINKIQGPSICLHKIGAFNERKLSFQASQNNKNVSNNNTNFLPLSELSINLKGKNTENFKSSENNFSKNDKKCFSNKLLNTLKIKVKSKSKIKINELKLNFVDLIFPFFLTKHNLCKDRFKMGEQLIYELLDVRNLITFMNQLNTIKNMILDDHQKVLFTYLFDPVNGFKIDKNEILCSYNILKEKKEENSVNKFLLENIDDLEN